MSTDKRGACELYAAEADYRPARHMFTLDGMGREGRPFDVVNQAFDVDVSPLASDLDSRFPGMMTETFTRMMMLHMSDRVDVRQYRIALGKLPTDLRLFDREAVTWPGIHATFEIIHDVVSQPGYADAEKVTATMPRGWRQILKPYAVVYIEEVEYLRAGLKAMSDNGDKRAEHSLFVLTSLLRGAGRDRDYIDRQSVFDQTGYTLVTTGFTNSSPERGYNYHKVTPLRNAIDVETEQNTVGYQSEQGVKTLYSVTPNTLDRNMSDAPKTSRAYTIRVLPYLAMFPYVTDNELIESMPGVTYNGYLKRKQRADRS